MKYVFEKSKREFVEMECEDCFSPVKCTRSYSLDENPDKSSLWSFTYRDFKCIEDAITYYQIAF